MRSGFAQKPYMLFHCSINLKPLQGLFKTTLLQLLPQVKDEAKSDTWEECGCKPQIFNTGNLTHKILMMGVYPAPSPTPVSMKFRLVICGLQACLGVKSERCWHRQGLLWHSSGHRWVPLWVYNIACLCCGLQTLCFEKLSTMQQICYFPTGAEHLMVASHLVTISGTKLHRLPTLEASRLFGGYR